MKRIIAASVAVVAIAAGVSATSLVAGATDIRENIGSVIKLSFSSEETTEVKKNIGSVIKAENSDETTVEADKNIGSVVKTNGTASSASGNIGSVIVIDGHGRDVNEVVKEVDIKKNIGSVIKIKNVCGDLDQDVDVSKNIGTVIKIDSDGDCEVDEAPAKDEEGEVLPAELPATGIELGGLVLAGIGLLAGATTYFIRRNN